MRTVATARTTSVLLAIAASLCVRSAFSHDHTRPAFEAARRAARRESHIRRASEKRNPCRLTVKLCDAETQAPLYGLVRITLVEQMETWPLDDALQRPMSWYAMPPEATVSVPQTKVRIEAVHGIETEVAERVVDLAGKATDAVKLPLERFYDPDAQGIRSGNTHLHLILDSHRKVGVKLRDRSEADRYLDIASRADGLDLVYVSYLTRPGATYITNDYTREDFERLSHDGVLFANGEEHRHAGRRVDDDPVMSYGHVMFLDLTELVLPVSMGPGLTEGGKATDDIPLRRGIEAAHRDQAGVVWCHGKQGLEDVPNMVTGLLHAQNIYDGGNEGTCSSVFYPYLNAGFRVPFSTGTDWGIWDFSRVYVPMDGPMSSKGFLKALAAGKSYITNGTFLEFRVDGAQIGDTLSLSQPRTVEVKGRAVGRGDFQRLELVHNGRIIHAENSRPARGRYKAEISLRLELSEPGWLALRIPTDREYNIRSRFAGKGTNVLGKALFAHTSPIYIELSGEQFFQPEAAESLIADMRRSMTIISEKGVFDTAHQRERILEIYREAIAVLRERLQRHAAGIKSR